MREPRRGLFWSRGTLTRRSAYATWMTSREWLASRERWRAAWVTEHGSEPSCRVCGRPWSLRRDDLHHRSYERLGHEHITNLVALCRRCHDKVHAVLEASPAWRRMDRVQASDLIVARLRRAAASKQCTAGVAPT